MGKLLKGAALLLGAAAAAEAGGTAYFYRRTMKRYNAKVERTMKMSGVDWESHFPIMHERQRLDDGAASRGCVDQVKGRSEAARYIFSGRRGDKGCHLFPWLHQQRAERLREPFLLLSETRLPDAPHR